MRGAIIAVALCCTGCETAGSTLVVEVKTDWVAGVEFTRVTTAVDEGPPRAPGASHEARFGDDYIGGVRVAELAVGAGNGLEQRTLLTQLWDREGRLVAARQTRVMLDEGMVVVKVVIARVESPRCANDSECTSGASCAEPVCVEETCLMAPI